MHFRTPLEDTAIINRYAAAVIFDKSDRVLLCRRSMDKKVAPGMWHLPGGTIEFDETPLETVARELKEELGLNVINVLPTCASITYENQQGNLKAHIFLVEVENEPTILNSENDQFVFAALEDFPKYIEPHLVVANKNAVLQAMVARDPSGII